MSILTLSFARTMRMLEAAGETTFVFMMFRELFHHIQLAFDCFDLFELQIALMLS